MSSNRRESVLSSLGLRSRATVVQSIVASGYLALAIFLGGATAEGAVFHAFLQSIAIVILAAILMRSGRAKHTRAEQQLLVLAMLLVAIFVLQLAPLPPALWRVLPGRQYLVDGFNALGVPMPWQPLSTAPAETVNASVALLPPLAMMLMIVSFERPVARVVALVLSFLTVISVLIGAAQISGSASLYFYSNTNGGSAVGFFSNANHFGTLICATLPLAAALIVQRRNVDSARRPSSRLFSIGAFVGLVLLGVLGILISGSVAAILLGFIGIAGAAAIVSGLTKKLQFSILATAVVVGLLALALTLAIAPGLFVAKSPGEGDMGRLEMWRLTLEAIRQFAPAGSGFGSFQQVYHLFEDPGQVSGVFVNHAHNDLLEFVLEGGVPGALLLLLFLAWFGKRLIALWLTDRDRDSLAQGASIAALILLLHSFLDYPLRTASMAVVMGFCCAVMARPPRSIAATKATDVPAAKHMAA